MEWSVDKFFVRFPEKGGDSSMSPIISAVHGARGNMYYENGDWLVEERKSRKIAQISPHDVRAREHYIKVIQEQGKKSKLFECGLCGRDFKNINYLKRHVVVHTDVRTYVCGLCQKRFKQKSTLIQHMATHGGSYRYECSDCSKSFVRLSTLAAHKRTHSKEKLFKCNYCPKSFHQRGNLNNHMYIHTGEKPFKCNQCGKEFNQKSNLNSHKKKIHLEEREKNETALLKMRTLIQDNDLANPNPKPFTIRNALHNQEINQEIYPLLVDTIVAVIQESPPPSVMKRASKNEKIFALLIDHGYSSMFRMIVRVFFIANDECALVRLNMDDCPNDRLVDVSWIVSHEKFRNVDKMYTLSDTAKDKRELKFSDELRGINIYKYIEYRSASTNKVSLFMLQDGEKTDDACDEENSFFSTESIEVSTEDQSDEMFNIIDISSDDSERLVVVEGEMLDESVIEEAVLHENILEEYIDVNNDESPLVLHPNSGMLYNTEDNIKEEDIDNLFENF